MRQARLIVDPPASGAWNMAVDEALLASAAEGAWTLRFYQWSEPTLSLGYFQPLADRARHPASAACAAVRRSTGGGAILHDQEWTYSLTCPCAERFSEQGAELYDAVHGALVELLCEDGLPARQYGQGGESAGGEREADRPGAAEPFLCFLRRSPHDVVVGEHKVAGSAQRRRAGALLQHGSVILRKSACAPEILGLEELLGASAPWSDAIPRWSDRLAQKWRVNFVVASISAAEQSAAQRWVEERFAEGSWLARR